MERNDTSRNGTRVHLPRLGSTEPQILAAIEALQARGKAITKITVRKERGGTGSYSTISAFLQRWRQDPILPSRRMRDHAAIPNAFSN